MTKMNAKCLSFAVLMLVPCVMPEAEFSPVKWSPFLSEQCGEHGNPDFSGVLTTPCMEVNENLPVHPSGYYTISGGTGESGEVIYCNMDDLSSYPALEQTQWNQENWDLFFARIDNLSMSSYTDSPVVSELVFEYEGDMSSL